VFDVRGLMAEEYVDAGRWRSGGLLFRLTKRLERLALRRSDAVICLTQWARDYLTVQSPNRPPHIEVIPCCYDPVRFRRASTSNHRPSLGLSSRLVIAYCGSLGGMYMTREMAAFFALCREKVASAHFLILTQSNTGPLSDELAGLHVPSESCTFASVPSGELPGYLGAADFGISFIKPTLSKRASSPTKIAEYLASGLPIISNSGIGEIDDLLLHERVGVLVRSFTQADYAASLESMQRLLADGEPLRIRCRSVAERYFSLPEIGVEGYRRVYRHLGWRPAADVCVPAHATGD
jgi:glycosyltransferase involved in cell wall biosynthesis